MLDPEVERHEQRRRDAARDREHGVADAGRGHLVGAALAISASAARPTAAPIPLAVDVIADATPCSRSATPVDAAMKIEVKTTPSARLTRISPGISSA